MELKLWPVDIDALKMGDYIDCIEFIKEPTYHRKFGIELLRIKDAIERQLERSGSTLHLRIDGTGLRVMTDAELAVYKRDACYKSISRLRRSARHLGDVNRDVLSDAEAKAHDSHTLRIARIVAAVDAAASNRKLPAPEPVQTALPRTAMLAASA